MKLVELNHHVMQKNISMRFVNSLLLLPLVTLSVPSGTIEKSDIAVEKSSQIAYTEKLNIPSLGLFSDNIEEKSEEEKILEIKAAAIDKYFADRSLPLEGYGRKMVLEAEENDIDWRLLPAIAMRESTGGKFACGGKLSSEWNPWGWNSCKGKGFSSMEESIEKMAQHLGGNHPKTKQWYADKTTVQILRTYNPPSVVAKYADQVVKIMNTISEQNIEIKNS